MLLFIKLGFFDILDILIVVFIFYQIYRLVKGTVAINIFAGIFTFYVAWLLVRALNMELITSIMGQFFGMGMIALLIVFQQEVRRFLLLVGSRYNLQNIFNLEKLFAKPVIKGLIGCYRRGLCEFFGFEDGGFDCFSAKYRIVQLCPDRGHDESEGDR